MKTSSILARLGRGTLLALIAAGASASAAVPGFISYQGSVADSAGNPVGAGTAVNRTMVFCIYGSPTGNDLLYAEQQVVTIADGEFNVLLGQGALVSAEPKPAIDSVFNGSDRFLGVTVDDGSPAADPEISPRQQLASTGFTFRAKLAETALNANTATNAATATRVQSDGSDSNFNWAYINNLTVQGHSKITGGNLLELGVGTPKNTTSGAIGYQSFSQGLDIVGAGFNAGDRRLTLWAEAGSEFKGPIYFGERVGQHINLYGSGYGIGIQSGTLYNRAYDAANSAFAWYFGGNHHNDQYNAGGGTLALALGRSGLWLPTGRIDMGNRHSPWAASFGSGHEVGSQDFTTYFRTAAGQGSFSWYLGGSHAGGQNDPGGGARLASWDNGGINFERNVIARSGLSVAAGSADFGARLGQHINLFAGSYGIGIQGATFYQRTDGTFSWYKGGSHSDNKGDSGGGSELANWDNGRLDFYRRVYVGANPTDGQAPIEINGGTNMGPMNVAEFWYPGGNGSGYNGRQNFSARVSLRASNSLLASNFLAASDSRIKLIEGRSDGIENLKTLTALEVTDYRLKDGSIDGGRRHRKLIAQQVEKVFPDAVFRSQGVVPDVFQKATAKEGVITFDEPFAGELKKGEVVRLVQGQRDFSAEITKVVEGGFLVSESIDEGELFVYGRKVEDFRSVDYESVAMLNVSATQELHRRVLSQDAQLKLLQEENRLLQKELRELKAVTGSQESRLAAIESILKENTLPSGKNTPKTASR